VSSPKTPTFISLSRADFLQLKDDPGFLRVVQLGRILNALRYTHMAGAAAPKENDTSARRQRIASFLYVTGLLYEGFLLADVLGKDFKASTTFQKGFASLLKKPDVVKLRQGILNDLRNKAVFHNDDDVVKLGLGLVDTDPVVFLRSLGGTWGSTHYDLADLAVLRYAFRHVHIADLDQEVQSTLPLILNVALEFGDCAEELMGEVLLEMGWQRQEEPPV